MNTKDYLISIYKSKHPKVNSEKISRVIDVTKFEEEYNNAKDVYEHAGEELICEYLDDHIAFINYLENRFTFKSEELKKKYDEYWFSNLAFNTRHGCGIAVFGKDIFTYDYEEAKFLSNISGFCKTKVFGIDIPLMTKGDEFSVKEIDYVTISNFLLKYGHISETDRIRAAKERIQKRLEER